MADCDSAQGTGDSGKSLGLSVKPQPGGKRRLAAVRPLMFGAVAVCALLWVAVYNGYPTVFSDTGSYLFTGAFLIALAPFRSPGYSIFTRLASLGVSGWFVVAMQAVVVVYALCETCAYLIGGEPKFRWKCLLVVICALAALTSLPWEVSLLMPDVFAGVVFLAAFLLAFNDGLRLGERVALAAILTISISAHASLLPIAGLFVAALVVLMLAGPAPAPAPRSVLAWLLVPIVAAGVGTAALNRRTGLGFRLSSSGNEFLLARLFADGLAADFLRENCPKEAFVACGYLGNLPRTQDEFLFHHPLLHEMEGHGNEIGEIVRGTLTAYPMRFAGSSLLETVRQLAAFRTGDEIRFSNAPAWNAEVMQRVFPRDVAAFSNSRQSLGGLVPLADAFARIHTAVFWLSLAGCIALAWSGRAVRMNRFFYAAMAFLAINAAICATLSGVFDRYQSRVAWIVPLCLMLYVCCIVEERNPANSSG